VTASIEVSDLARILPGAWRITATNVPMWLGNTRLGPVLTYGLLSRDPLALTDVVHYETPDGAAKSIVGVDRDHGGEFHWRRRGLLGLRVSRWRVVGVDEDSGVLALRFGKSLTSPAGIDVVVREGSDVGDGRSVVAARAASFGLSLEDFASLTWLTPRAA
jgi:hypothetical protein